MESHIKDSDIEAYISRFNDLTLLCPGMITSESKKVKRFIWGVTPPIQGKVIVANPSTFDSAKRKIFTTMENQRARRLLSLSQRRRMITRRTGERREKENRLKSRGRRNKIVAIHAATTPTTSTTATLAPAKPYTGPLLKCDKCNSHHNDTCRDLQCTNYNRRGLTAQHCRSPPQQNNQPNNAGASQACYGCGETDHFKRNCPKANNWSARGTSRVLAMGQREAV